ncbi:acyl transferase [Abyssalbus ytuae]|uniref:Acyl transferase n=2 Tax=Abyssalbus ytuae TaxID=2926907 RepID=A0A9E7A1V5_9FLAO|nr:acyl transferase [Abyssalbus ytuae]UOB19492.1 acyl transferase [Abyssalbus ytuae]
MDSKAIFSIQDPIDFEEVALQVFELQYNNNPVYQLFCTYLKKSPENVATLNDIPFLPIEFFKSKKILSSSKKVEKVFTSSGTTGMATSKHYVAEMLVYEESYLKCFESFYGPAEEYIILALLPSYLEREGSSLIYMVNDLIKKSGYPESGFYLHNHSELAEKLVALDRGDRKVLLIGVSFALLDLVEKYKFGLNNTIIMETGGMKGRRKELIREELHAVLCEGFGINKIHSEYGMTELLSQAYSYGDGFFKCPPWMKVLIRDTEDPLTLQAIGKTGGLNIIDLANIHSCSFIATQDLGKVCNDNTFTVLGRFDNSDIRGCNLMVI